ncbi:MAG: hypothetical protein ACYCW6_32615, partial [Candidatus Xenobia bacterium]
RRKGPARRRQITFDPKAPNHSVDNLEGDAPVPAFYDVGSSTSVPPFCIDLIMQITTRGQSRLFEARLRRRWPYAIFTQQGPIALEGSPGPGSSTTFNPTVVHGDVYNLLQPPSTTGWDPRGEAREAGLLI